MGAVPIPLYQDAAALGVCSINNADVRFAFAEDQEQVDKLLEIRENARSSRTFLMTRAACANTTSRGWPRWNS